MNEDTKRGRNKFCFPCVGLICIHVSRKSDIPVARVATRKGWGPLSHGRRLCPYLLLQYDVFPLPIFHHAQCLKSAYNIVRVDGHLLTDVCKQGNVLILTFTVRVGSVHTLC
jgi:hypothetical protein